MRATSGWFHKVPSVFMAMIRQGIPVVAVGIFMVAALALGWATTAAAAAPLPVTGQKTCYKLERYNVAPGHPLFGTLVLRDANTVTEFNPADPAGAPNPTFDPFTATITDQIIPCAGTGQDGEHQYGRKLRYTDGGDGRIYDRNTSLTWAKKSDDGGFHDKDDTYTWDEAFEYIRTMNNTCHLSQIGLRLDAAGNRVPPTPCVTNLHCPAAGDVCGFAGRRDWRLPNIKELGSIVDFSVFSNELAPAPTVHPAFNTNCKPGVTVLTGSCTHSDNIDNATEANFVPMGTPGSLLVPYTYWTSTSGNSLGDAWFVDFFTGDNGAHFKDTDLDIDITVDPPLVTHAGHVRAVLGGESSLDDDAP